VNTLRTVVYAGLYAALITLSGCSGPLVGLECQDGFVRCGSACYALESDLAHCGACDIACSADQQCVAAQCVAAPDPDGGGDGLDDGAVRDGGDARVADAGDARVGDGGDAGAADAGDARVGDAGDGGPSIGMDGGDGSVGMDGGDGGPSVGMDGGDGSVGMDGSADSEGGAGDGGGTADGRVEVDGNITVPSPVICFGPGSPEDCTCGLDQPTRCGPINEYVCVDTTNDPRFCGACDNICPADQVCSNSVCRPICEAPLTFCSGLCVDLTSNDQFCGSCTIACGALAACINGICEGRAVGHVVLLGHDLSVLQRPSIPRLLGNAVFLTRAAVTRVLVLNTFTDAASNLGLTTALATAAAERTRLYTTITANPATLREQLSDADVFVVNVQQSASDLQLRTWGSEWAAAFDDFLFRGGVIVVLDAGVASNAGTYQLLEAATVTRGSVTRSLLPISARRPLSQRLLRLASPNDAIATNIPNPYPSEADVAGFIQAAVANPGVVVVESTVVGGAGSGPGVLADGGLDLALPVVIHNTVVD
jgi:hypothetical protein